MEINIVEVKHRNTLITPNTSSPPQIAHRKCTNASLPITLPTSVQYAIIILESTESRFVSKQFVSGRMKVGCLSKIRLLISRSREGNALFMATLNNIVSAPPPIGHRDQRGKRPGKVAQRMWYISQLRVKMFTVSRVISNTTSSVWDNRPLAFLSSWAVCRCLWFLLQVVPDRVTTAYALLHPPTSIAPSGTGRLTAAALRSNIVFLSRVAFYVPLFRPLSALSAFVLFRTNASRRNAVFIHKNIAI